MTRRLAPGSRQPAGAARIIAAPRTGPSRRQAGVDFTSPLELLIALILAAQCTDAKVNEVTGRALQTYRTAADYAGVPAKSSKAVRPTGFYRQKTKAIQRCCLQLVERFGGEVPRILDAL